jgi:polar amino acid transport system permease protein
MVADDLIAVAPPGERRAVPFRGNTRSSVIAVVGAVAVTVFMWAMLWKFDQSLHVNQARQTTARVFEVIIAVATLAVPFYAFRALARALRGDRLARAGDRRSGQIAIADSRDDVRVVIGIGLSAFVIAFLAFLVSANQGSVRNVLFNWTLIWRSRTALLHGFWLNIKLFVVSEAIVLVWALVVAIVRMLPGRACAPIRALAIVYTDVFRGVPALITIYLVVFGFSLADVPPFNHLHGTSQLFWLGVFALVLVYGAYVAEVYRAGLESIHWSQTAAARSLGLTQGQTLRHVVVPQAVRRIVPPLMNDFVALQKDTTLLSIVGIVDILGEATLLKAKYFNLSAVTGASICFLVITIPFTRLTDYLIKRDRERTMAR